MSSSEELPTGRDTQVDEASRGGTQELRLQKRMALRGPASPQLAMVQRRARGRAALLREKVAQSSSA